MPRQLTFDQLPKRRGVCVALKKHSPDSWLVVDPDRYSTCYKSKIDQSIYNSSYAYVFRMALNESHQQIQCDLDARFKTMTHATEYLENGKLKCTYPCRHPNRECKQQRKPVSNTSENWQYAYFVLHKRKFTFRPYTTTHNRIVCKIITQ